MISKLTASFKSLYYKGHVEPLLASDEKKLEDMPDTPTILSASFEYYSFKNIYFIILVLIVTVMNSVVIHALSVYLNVEFIALGKYFWGGQIALLVLGFYLHWRSKFMRLMT